MFELVNKYHPDKVADRIAGAIVDLAYKKKEDAVVAVEVLIGHGICQIINETNTKLPSKKIEAIVKRIAGDGFAVTYTEVMQDEHLAKNVKPKEGAYSHVGDNGIFKGTPFTHEQLALMRIRDDLEEKYHSDGKYILDEESSTLIVCQSNADTKKLRDYLHATLPYIDIRVNPLGDWTGGTDVDSGATNRKLGSDMGDAMTGGGLHGKDLSKADLTVNVYLSLLAREENRVVTGFCAIGSVEIYIDGHKDVFDWLKPRVKRYIKEIGGFEKFAEHGLMR